MATIQPLTWLPEVLEAAGLKVAETPGWRTRGTRGDMGRVRGVMCHHTATAAPGNMPTLRLLIDGRRDLSGPLAQLGLGRDGTFYVVAAGRANHAGTGEWEGITAGNSSFIGIEAENSGLAGDPWPAVQIDAYQRGVAALLKHIGADANMCCGHKEYALPRGRKTDPDFDMPAFRSAVRGFMLGKTPAPPIPAVDDQARPTLRRGDSGPMVAALQRALGLDDDGKFGPATEKAVRAAQRTAGLTPDGIIGPKSWAALAAATVAPLVPAPAATPSAQPTAQPVVPPVKPTTTAAVAALPPSALPDADTDSHRPRVTGGIAFGPDGTRFASRLRAGFFTMGVTPAATWLAGAGAAGVAPSIARIVAASCANEGGLEAVNSWDNAHLSVGICQWTAGAGGDPGELAVLLRRIRALDADAYEDCFGRYGLAPVQPDGDAVGLLAIGGKPLDSDAAKQVLRGVEWAWRCWRAAHHPAVRRAQVTLAADRIKRFIDVDVSGHPVRAWLSSELGMALLLDEHVNRPGHVPGTLSQAIDKLAANARDCATWQTEQERALIDQYLRVRATTNMTHGEQRGNAILALATASKLSGERGSFVLT